MLPKGTFAGLDYQFYVIVSPFVPYTPGQAVDGTQFYYPRVGTGAQYFDGYPLGFPFDRPIYSEPFFYNVPNSYFYTAKIYQRAVEDINSSSAGQN